MKTATFPHIPPGIQAARLLSVRPLLETLCDPLPNYGAAMAYFAASLLRFVDEPAIADLLGQGDLSSIRARAVAAPGTFARAIYTLRSATDDALAANRKIMVARESLERAAAINRDDHSAIARSALLMLDAQAEHSALTN